MEGPRNLFQGIGGGGGGGLVRLQKMHIGISLSMIWQIVLYLIIRRQWHIVINHRGKGSLTKILLPLYPLFAEILTSSTLPYPENCQHLPLMFTEATMFYKMIIEDKFRIRRDIELLSTMVNETIYLKYLNGHFDWKNLSVCVLPATEQTIKHSRIQL